jgi:hypothetical protein
MSQKYAVGDRVRQLPSAFNALPSNWQADSVPAGTLGTVRHAGGSDRPAWSMWSQLQVEFDGYPESEFNYWPMGYDEVEPA